MSYHDHGPLIGKTTVDNATDLTPTQRDNHAAQRAVLERFGKDARFREAVRMAARADGTIGGGETAVEQLYRHQCDSNLTCRGMVAGHNLASKIVGVKQAIIRI